MAEFGKKLAAGMVVYAAMRARVDVWQEVIREPSWLNKSDLDET